MTHSHDDKDIEYVHVSGRSDTDSCESLQGRASNDMSREPAIDEVVEKVTHIIKDDVQLLFIFNHEFGDNYKAYSGYPQPFLTYEPHDHRLILPVWLPPTIKAGILETLSEEQFITMMHDKHLMQEVFPFLNDKLFMQIILTFVDSITIPVLLKSPPFLTDMRVKSLADNGAMFYGIEYRHLIANRIDPFDPVSVKGLTLNICPKNVAGVKEVLNCMKQYVTDSVYATLEVKMFEILQQHFDTLKITSGNNDSVSFGDSCEPCVKSTRPEKGTWSKIGTSILDAPNNAINAVTGVTGVVTGRITEGISGAKSGVTMVVDEISNPKRRIESLINTLSKPKQQLQSQKEEN